MGQCFISSVFSIASRHTRHVGEESTGFCARIGFGFVGARFLGGIFVCEKIILMFPLSQLARVCGVFLPEQSPSHCDSFNCRTKVKPAPRMQPKNQVSSATEKQFSCSTPSQPFQFCLQIGDFWRAVVRMKKPQAHVDCIFNGPKHCLMNCRARTGLVEEDARVFSQKHSVWVRNCLRRQHAWQASRLTARMETKRSARHALFG